MSTVLIQDLHELRRRLAPHLGGAVKAIVFGSAARGEEDEWSDLDLVVVAKTSRPFFERFKDFAGLYDVWPRLDLLVYTPEEFQRKAARAEAQRWLAQAESDLGFAKLGVDGGYHAQACFMCQQAAEKALKVLDTLAPRHPALTALREAAQQLDQYYVPTRYPNGLPSGTPAEVFTKRQASEAVALAARILDQARSTIASRPP